MLLSRAMKTRDFHFDLPRRLIAQQPLAQRTASRLLALDGASGEVQDLQFRDVPDCLRPGDLLVFNDTRVIPARLFGAKETGGRVEVLVERVQGEHQVLAHVRASKAPRPGSRLLLEGDLPALVNGRQGELFELHFETGQPVIQVLETRGHMPLPPYIERTADSRDEERYQTVYARKPGAVAAPTAGLHFDDALLRKVVSQGVETAYVTLHVGAGTFQPVRVDRIEEHRMHSEYLEVDEFVCEQVAAARERGGRVVAVGTTAVRSLESAARAGGGVLQPYRGETDIFIYPGYRFQIVDALITNFHLPGSTLLMLVSAFAGHAHVMAAYRHAVEQEYRFFSYGDAMFITRAP